MRKLKDMTPDMIIHHIRCSEIKPETVIHYEESEWWLAKIFLEYLKMKGYQMSRYHSMEKFLGYRKTLKYYYFYIKEDKFVEYDHRAGIYREWEYRDKDPEIIEISDIVFMDIPEVPKFQIGDVVREHGRAEEYKVVGIEWKNGNQYECKDSKYSFWKEQRKLELVQLYGSTVPASEAMEWIDWLK